MKPQRVRLFIKSFCPWCHQAIRWLDEQGIAYETLDVLDDDEARAEMNRLSNQDLAPVIEVDGKVLADFGADELEEWWHEQKFHQN
jgi:glutaredoxin 3